MAGLLEGPSDRGLSPKRPACTGGRRLMSFIWRRHVIVAGDKGLLHDRCLANSLLSSFRTYRAYTVGNYNRAISGGTQRVVVRLVRGSTCPWRCLHASNLWWSVPIRVRF